MQLFLRDNVGNYNDESGRCDLPNTSQISPYLHFGQISPRTVLSECYHLRKRSPKYLRFEHAISTEIQILARIESQMPCNSLFLLKSIFCLLPLGVEYFEDSFQTCFLNLFNLNVNVRKKREREVRSHFGEFGAAVSRFESKRENGEQKRPNIPFFLYFLLNFIQGNWLGEIWRIGCYGFTLLFRTSLCGRPTESKDGPATRDI